MFNFFFTAIVLVIILRVVLMVLGVFGAILTGKG